MTLKDNWHSDSQTLIQHLNEIEELLNRQELETHLLERTPSRQHELLETVLSKQHQSRLQIKLKKLHPADLSYILESFPLDQRLMLWRLMSPEDQGQVLIEISDAVRQTLLSDMDTAHIESATQGLQTDEIADLAADLPKKVMRNILRSLNDDKRAHLQSVIDYSASQIGALMDFNVIRVREDMTLKTILRYIRKRKKLPSHTDKLFVVDNKGYLTGELPIETLLTAERDAKVQDIMMSGMLFFQADGDADDAARAFERYDLVSAPVVNEQGEFLGRLCVDAVMDYIRRQNDEDILFQAGMAEQEDLFASIWNSARNRWAWLLVNVMTALIATRIIGWFETTILQVVALASLMPIVAAIGGNTGNQTSMLIIRSLALGQLHSANIRHLVLKELSIGLLNGVVWGSLIGVLVWGLYQDQQLGLVMCAAMMLNLLVAAGTGVAVPLIQDKLGRDPAVGTSVMITFITDTMGFMIFLGLATLFLLS